jgi:hypothetical protein
MTLTNHWCVIGKRKETALRQRTLFPPVSWFSCELDLGEGMEYTVRAAFFHGVRQHGGEYADAAEYRMDVYASSADDHALLPGFTVPADAAVDRPAGSLADYGDDELISELARRLRGR